MKRKRRRGRRELEKRVEYLRKEKDGNHEKFYTLLFFDFFLSFFLSFFLFFFFFFDCLRNTYSVRFCFRVISGSLNFPPLLEFV